MIDWRSDEFCQPFDGWRKWVMEDNEVGDVHQLDPRQSFDRRTAGSLRLIDK